MTMLKHLYDFKAKDIQIGQTKTINTFRKVLKTEAIKWIKHFRYPSKSTIKNQPISFIMDFFCIDDEEIAETCNCKRYRTTMGNKNFNDLCPLCYSPLRKVKE